MHKNVVYQDWGMIDYKMAWEKQESINYKAFYLRLLVPDGQDVVAEPTM